MNASDFINNSKLKSLLITFFNLSGEDEKCFVIKSSYKKSKLAKITLNDELKKQNNKLLNSWSNMEFELKSGTHIYKIFKDNNNSNLETFLKNVYKKIIFLIPNHSEDEVSKLIMLSAFILRGSYDSSASYFSIDIPKILNKPFYYEYLIKILLNTDVTALNLNFRELQDNYVTETNKRNTQLRVHLKYFSENFLTTIEEINLYKYDIFFENRQTLKNKTTSSEFLERAIYYINKILKNKNISDSTNKKIYESEINKLRNELGFNNTSTKHYISRSSKLIQFAKYTLEDECYSCKGIYNKEDRTFKLRNTDHYYFEIHHVLSFASDKHNNDQIDNLVKLCPACHRALTPNRADETYQKEIIKRILKNSENAYNFISSYVDNLEVEEMVEFIYKNLK